MTEEDPRFKYRRVDWDVRGIIAVMALLGAFGLAVTQLVLRQAAAAEIPTWAAALVSAITGFYFGSRGGTNNGH